MSFITLTTIDDDFIQVRADSIVEIWRVDKEEKRTPPHTCITLVNGSGRRVVEPPGVITQRINDAIGRASQ